MNNVDGLRCSSAAKNIMKRILEDRYIEESAIVEENEREEYPNDPRRRLRGIIEENNFPYVNSVFDPDSYNQIPSDKPGSCHRLLIVICKLNEDFYKRLEQTLEHIYVHCPKQTKVVEFITERWDETDFQMNHTYLNFRRITGMQIKFFLRNGNDFIEYYPNW